MHFYSQGQQLDSRRRKGVRTVSLIIKNMHVYRRATAQRNHVLLCTSTILAFIALRFLHCDFLDHVHAQSLMRICSALLLSLSFFLKTEICDEEPFE